MQRVYPNTIFKTINNSIRLFHQSKGSELIKQNVISPSWGSVMNKINEKQLLEKANKPAKDAMKLHPFYHGKIEVLPKCRINDFQDFAIWYTPGVAEPC